MSLKEFPRQHGIFVCVYVVGGWFSLAIQGLSVEPWLSSRVLWTKLASFTEIRLYPPSKGWYHRCVRPPPGYFLFIKKVIYLCKAFICVFLFVKKQGFTIYQSGLKHISYAVSATRQIFFKSPFTLYLELSFSHC